MAKGNMLLGYSRGSVGDVVFARSKGQQVARARNRKPKNPKTKAQMAQRIKFASVVEFFRRGQQNLFQFAFENKKSTQSDYNAFVSANADKGIYLTPEQLKNPKFPIIAPFIVSRGSLERPIQYQRTRYPFGAVERGTEEMPTTIGALSQLLIHRGFELNDIVTIVAIEGSMQTVAGKPYTPNEGNAWVIRQFIVDTTNQATIESAGFEVNEETEDEMLVFEVEANFTPTMGCIIVSRKELDGLKVTNTEIHLESNVYDANTNASSEPWISECIDIWGASEESILQGSLS